LPRWNSVPSRNDMVALQPEEGEEIGRRGEEDDHRAARQVETVARPQAENDEEDAEDRRQHHHLQDIAGEIAGDGRRQGDHHF